MDSPHSNPRPPETPCRSRRDTLRESLIDEMKSHHIRRRSRKRLLATACLMLLVGVLMIPMIRNLNQTDPIAKSPEPMAGPRVEEPALVRLPSVQIRMVSTDKNILERYAASPAPGLIERIDDQTLLATLAAMDRPTGLVRSEGRVWLTSDVTDEFDFEVEPEPSLDSM